MVEQQSSDYGFQVVNPITQATQPSQSNYRREEENPLMQLLSRSDMLKIIQEYLEDKKIPIKETEDFWGIHSKFLSISFFNREDVDDILLVRENVELIDIMSKPPEDYTWARMQNFEQMKIFVRSQIKRSVGDGTTNERKLQNTQIGQMITTSSGMPTQSRTGLKGTIQKIFG